MTETDMRNAEKKMLDAWAEFVKIAELPPDSFPSPEMGKAWIASIVIAVEEEREACAQIADRWFGDCADMIRARNEVKK
jgi:hypothetical protein